MEKDYYGALVGGILFAFFALPYFGLTYTPIALGIINFLVASILFWRFRHLLHYKKSDKDLFLVNYRILHDFYLCSQTNHIVQRTEEIQGSNNL
jgi:predicted membrane-bound spermidine synthase